MADKLKKKDIERLENTSTVAAFAAAEEGVCGVSTSCINAATNVCNDHSTACSGDGNTICVDADTAVGCAAAKTKSTAYSIE